MKQITILDDTLPLSGQDFDGTRFAWYKNYLYWLPSNHVIIGKISAAYRGYGYVGGQPPTFQVGGNRLEELYFKSLEDAQRAIADLIKAESATRGKTTCSKILDFWLSFGKTATELRYAIGEGYEPKFYDGFSVASEKITEMSAKIGIDVTAEQLSEWWQGICHEYLAKRGVGAIYDYWAVSFIPEPFTP